jgi:hypothetical protein
MLWNKPERIQPSTSKRENRIAMQETDAFARSIGKCVFQSGLSAFVAVCVRFCMMLVDDT